MADDAPAPPTGPDDPLTKMMLGVQEGGTAADAPPPVGAPGHGPGGESPPPQPAGPPRLRGQGAPPSPQPGAPPEDLSLPAVWEGAKKNFTRSAAGNIASTAEFLNPMNWGRDAAGIGAIGQGVLSKAGLIDQGDPKAQAAHQAGVNAIENMNWEHYGTVDNFLRTMKNDPTTPLADAAAVASLLTGGEGLAARVPGVAGDVLRAGMTGAKVAQYGDPTYAALKAAGAGAKAVGAAGRLAGKIPGAGLVGELAGMSGGAGLGHVLSHAIPLPGAEIMGGFLGDKIAKGAMRVMSKGVPGPVKSIAGAVVRDVPRAGGIARALPASAQEQQAAGAVQKAYTPPGAPDAAPLPTDPDDAQLQQMERDFGLISSAPVQPSAGLQGGAPLPAPRGAMYGHIANIATNAGANPTEVSTLQHIARVESGGNPNARSPSGRYHGLFQYADSGGDPEADTVRALGDLRHNEQRLKAMGVDPDAGALYVMHQQGAGGGPALLTAPPGTGAIDAIARYYGSRAVARQAIAHNIGYKYGTPEQAAAANAAAEHMTAADFVNLWRNKLSGVPFADGGRVEYAAGGQVVDLTERLMKRASTAQNAAQAATRPLLGLSDDTVAQALRVAQRGL